MFEKQGWIHGHQMCLVLYYAIFSNFYKSVTDQRTDGWTHPLIEMRGAYKNRGIAGIDCFAPTPEPLLYVAQPRRLSF